MKNSKVKKKIIKTRADINEIDMKKTIEKNSTKLNWPIEKMNKIGKTSDSWKWGKNSNQYNHKWKMRSYNGHHRNTRIIRDYYEQLYANKMDSLEEMDKILERYKLPRLIKE